MRLITRMVAASAPQSFSNLFPVSFSFQSFTAIFSVSFTEIFCIVDSILPIGKEDEGNDYDGAPVAVYTDHDQNGDEIGTIYEIIKA